MYSITDFTYILNNYDNVIFSIKMDKDLIVHVKTQEQIDELINGNTPVILFFSGNNCYSCKELCPVFEDRAINSFGKFIFAKLHVDDFASLAYRFEYQSAIPYVALLKNGKLVKSFEGANFQKMEGLISLC